MLRLGFQRSREGRRAGTQVAFKRSRAAFSGSQKARKGADVHKPEAGESLSAVFLWRRLEDAADCGERREGRSER